MDLDHTAERRIGRFVYLSYTVRRAPREQPPRPLRTGHLAFTRT